MSEEKKSRKIRISSSCGDEITISGLTSDEREKIEGIINGHYWVTCVGGRLEFIESRHALPKPADDTEMMPFWRPADPKKGKQKGIFHTSSESFEIMEETIFIQHLCGYNYSEANYKFCAEQLEGYGFICLRSRRDKGGRFWETWYLPGLWSAKGDLADFLNECGRNTEKAISFLCRHVSFGTLDTAKQRAAMVMDD